jgi:hypothetical protein
MLPLIAAQTVGLTVGSEDRFREGKYMAGKLERLDVEREIRPGKYPTATLSTSSANSPTRATSTHWRPKAEMFGSGLESLPALSRLSSPKT